MIPPLLIVNVAALSPPPILFWPSESWPMVPDSPPEAVSPKEQDDLGREKAEAPRNKDEITREYIAKYDIKLNECS